MATTNLTVKTDELGDLLDNLARRWAPSGMVFELRCTPYSNTGTVTVTLTTPSGVPVPDDPGPNPRYADARAEIARLTQELHEQGVRLEHLAVEATDLRAERDAANARVQKALDDNVALQHEMQSLGDLLLDAEAIGVAAPKAKSKAQPQVEG